MNMKNNDRICSNCYFIGNTEEKGLPTIVVFFIFNLIGFILSIITTTKIDANTFKGLSQIGSDFILIMIVANILIIPYILWKNTESYKCPKCKAKTCFL